MMLEMEKRISTGHRDCCGDMILRKDTVYTKDGEARVIWACGRWWLYFAEGPKRPLNGYPARELRRWDNSGTIRRDNEEIGQNRGTIVPGQSIYCPKDCPEDCPAHNCREVNAIVYRGTMGQ